MPTASSQAALTVWALADGRAGHWNQVRGLCEALARRLPVQMTTIEAPVRARAVRNWLRRSWPEVIPLPAPDLIIGAGHGTHLPLLLARHLRGGRTVVIMKPSLPLRWFDLSLVPDMQPLPGHPKVVATRGALNRVRSTANLDPAEGTILLGGPSSHCGWDGELVSRQIDAICTAAPQVRWELSTSRRTPAGFANQLRELPHSHLTVLEGSDTGPDWLPRRLARSARTWVSADSVSMIYECLTAGAAVGLLTVPLKKPRGKMARNIADLIAAESITTFEHWSVSGRLRQPRIEYDEAERCAALIVERFELAGRAAA